MIASVVMLLVGLGVGAGSVVWWVLLQVYREEQQEVVAVLRRRRARTQSETDIMRLTQDGVGAMLQAAFDASRGSHD